MRSLCTWRGLRALLGVAVVVLLCSQWGLRLISRIEAQPQPWCSADLTVCMAAGHAWTAGGDPYGMLTNVSTAPCDPNGPYTYPSWTLPIVGALATLSVPAAAAWSIRVLCACLVASWVFWALASRVPPWRFAAALFALQWGHYELDLGPTQGNIEPVLVLGNALAAWHLSRDRVGRSACWSVACAGVKPDHLLIPALWALARPATWRRSATVLAGGLALLVAMEWAIGGPHAWGWVDRARIAGAEYDTFLWSMRVALGQWFGDLGNVAWLFVAGVMLGCTAYVLKRRGVDGAGLALVALLGVCIAPRVKVYTWALAVGPELVIWALSPWSLLAVPVSHLDLFPNASRAVVLGVTTWAIGLLTELRRAARRDAATGLCLSASRAQGSSAERAS